MKRSVVILLTLSIVFSLAACGRGPNGAENAAVEPTATEQTPEPVAQPTAPPEPVTVRVASLKGPTSMGLVNLMKRAETEGAVDGLDLDFRIETDASAVAALVVSGDADIALLPANLASVLYKRTEGGVTAININTLGVLYCVTGEEGVSSIADLAGRTIVMTGQGTTPEYSLRHLMAENGIEDYDIEFKSEATEVAAVLAADPSRVAVLPQPFATAAMLQNTTLREAFSLADAWEALDDGSKLVTGVTLVGNDFLEEHPEAVEAFLTLHSQSAAKANSDVEGTAQLVAEYGIIEKAPVAQKALPKCSIVSITGTEMRLALEGYLTVLWSADPASVGGALPENSFYYGGQ